MNFFQNIKSKLLGLTIFTTIGFFIILASMYNMVSTNTQNTSLIGQIEFLHTSTRELRQIALTNTRGDEFAIKYKETQLIYKGISSQTDVLQKYENSLQETKKVYTQVYNLQIDIDENIERLTKISNAIDTLFTQVYDYKVLFYFTNLKLITKNFIKDGIINLKDLRKTQTKFRSAVRGSEEFITDMKAQRNVTAQIVKYRKILSDIIRKTKLINEDKKLLQINTTKTFTLLANAKKELFNEVENKNKTVTIITNAIALLLIITIISISFIISKGIQNNLINFEKGLYEFFDVISHKTNKANKIDIKNKDEIAQMAEKVNQNIEVYTKLINHNKEVLEEANDVLQKVANGFYGYKIPHHENVSPEVKELIININKMLDQTKNKFDILNNALHSYGQYNFDYTIPKKNETGLCGDFGTLVASTKLIGNNVAEFLAMLINTGNQLNSDTSVLSNSAIELSNASNTQAVSLEETAASLEQITTNINHNTENVTIMSQNANELYETSMAGKTLAQKTSNSMDQIDSQVQAINEAISLIDQIAFQTNILSLNAAVEAATAGEAGKGFAVVAGEVRNLASRSAEAANEIKQLVQKATLQTKEGKDITAQMSKGYEQLALKIDETTQIIQSVSTASKEQQLGISQINTAVTQLDTNTQINAQNAQHISRLSLSISELSQDLLNLADGATFKDKIKQQVCDIDLVHQTSKIKNNHIELKSKNIEKIGTFEKWNITLSSQCEMGKWIVAMENEKKPYTNDPLWEEIKSEHKLVHNLLQTYIDKNHERVSNNELSQLAQDIENHTLTLFDKLDQLKIVNCTIIGNNND